MSALSYQMMKSMPIFPTAVCERECEQEIPSNPPGFFIERGPEDRNRLERDDQGTLVERPSEIPSEHVSNDSNIGADAAIQPGKSKGEWQ